MKRSNSLNGLINTAKRFEVLSVFGAVLLGTGQPAAAANLYWSANGTTASGTGTWDTTTANHWGTAAGGPYTLAWNNTTHATYIAVLGTVEKSVLTLGSDITCGGIWGQQNSTGSGTINEGAGPYKLTLGASNSRFIAYQAATATRPLNINVVVAGVGKNLILEGPPTTGASPISLNRANTFSGSTSFDGHTNGAVNLTLGHQLALQNSTLTLSAYCNSLIFNSSVAANAFTFGGLAAASAGDGRNIFLKNNAATPAAIVLSVGNNNANTTYAGVLSGSGSLVKIGTGILTLSGTNTYTGATTISNGTLSLTGSLLGGTAISTSGTGILNESAAGVISDAASFTQGSSGTSILSGVNTYTGDTTVSAGKLAFGRSDALSTNNNVVLSGGTLDVGAFSPSLGTLKVTGNATLALGAGEISFLISRDLVWTEGATLTLTGTLGDTTLRFGTSASALTSAQLARITYNSKPVYLDSNGYMQPGTAGTVILLQ